MGQSPLCLAMAKHLHSWCGLLVPSCMSHKVHRKRSSRRHWVLFPEYRRSVSYESSWLSCLLANNPNSSFLHIYLLCSSSAQLGRCNQEHRLTCQCSRSTGQCSTLPSGHLFRSRLRLVDGWPLGLTFWIVVSACSFWSSCQKSLSLCTPSDRTDKLHTTQEAVTSSSCEMLVCQQTAVSEDDKDLWWFSNKLRPLTRIAALLWGR